MIYPLQAIREIPLAAAQRFAGIAVKSRRWALLYVVFTFYGLPALFAFLNRFLN